VPTGMMVEPASVNGPVKRGGIRSPFSPRRNGWDHCSQVNVRWISTIFAAFAGSLEQFRRAPGYETKNSFTSQAKKIHDES
jgi:hypothetical protein